MTIDIVLNLVVVVVLVLMFFVCKGGAWKKVFAILLFLDVIFLLAFGGDSLRTQADLARAQGRTFEFVEGLARMSKSMMPSKISIAVAALGLLIIGLANKGK